MCGVANRWVCPFANDQKEDTVTTPAEERQACSSKDDALLLSQEVRNTRELLDIVSKVFFEKDSQEKNESKDSYVEYCRRNTNGMTHNSDEFLAKKNVKKAWGKKLIKEEIKKTFRIIQNNPERVKSAYRLNDISYLNSPVQQNVTKAGKNRRKLCRSAPLLRSIFDSGEKYNSGQLEDLCLVPVKNVDTLDVDSIQLNIEDIESYDEDDPYPFARFRNHVHRKGMGPKSDLKNTYIIPTLPKSSFSRNEKEDQETKGKLTPTPENDSTRADGTLSNVNSCETPFSVTINEVAVDKNEKATLDELERSKVSEDKDHLLADQQVSSVTSSRCPGDEVVEANYSKIKQDINASLPDTDQGHTDQEVSPKKHVTNRNQSFQDAHQLNLSEHFPGNSLFSKQKTDEKSLPSQKNTIENSLTHKHRAGENLLFANHNLNENLLPTKYNFNEKPKLDQSFIDEYNTRIRNPTEASTRRESSKVPTQPSLTRPTTGTRNKIRTKTKAQRVKESQNTLNGSSRKSTPRTGPSTPRRKRVNYEEKIRSLDNQNIENQRKLAELQQEEEFLIQTKLKLREDLDDFSNKESKMKLERSKEKVILNEKLKIMKIEEKRRRKTEADRQREEKKRMEEKIATNKLKLEKLPLEKEKEIKELMEKLKKLEDDKKKQEKIAIKREKDLRAKVELEEKQLIEEDEEKEQKLMKQLQEEKEHNESLLQNTHQKLKTIQNKKKRQTVFGKQEQERITQEKEKFLQKEKERMEREAREKEERIQKEKEAQEQAIIDMQTRREQALKRRDFNRDMKKNLAESKRNQAINRTTFSYFQAIPKKTWELPIGWQKRPTYKPGGIRIKT